LISLINKRRRWEKKNENYWFDVCLPDVEDVVVIVVVVMLEIVAFEPI